MGVQCFMLRETGKLKRGLRRYGGADCASNGGYYHNGMADLDITDHPIGEVIPIQEHLPHDDSRWPTKCGCGYVFLDTDEWQIFTDRIYVRSDNGEETTLDAAPPGAMWDAWWYANHWKGADGISLMVRCPDGHDWCVDSRCSNCDKPDDNIHKCWIRHGIPPNITVDKNGVTCGAGAGSIQTPKWHGYLRNGELIQC